MAPVVALFTQCENIRRDLEPEFASTRNVMSFAPLIHWTSAGLVDHAPTTATPAKVTLIHQRIRFFSRLDYRVLA